MATVSITDLTNAKLDTDHIADIATSLALTAVDRLGTTKKTLQGAINSIAAIDVKGAWATTTAYVVKDAVLESGTWYICIEAHTSATFSTDLAAGKWSVLQGITDANLKDYAVRKLDFVSDMKAMSNPQAGEIIMLKDYASGNGAGVMYFETKATTGTDDGGSVINHNTLAFRFEQIFGEEIHVKQFGAVGDDSTVNTVSVGYWLDYIIANNRLSVVSDGVFLSDAIAKSAASGIKIRFDGTLKATGANKLNFIKFTGVSNKVIITGHGKIDGNNISARPLEIENTGSTPTTLGSVYIGANFSVINAKNNAPDTHTVAGIRVHGGFSEVDFGGTIDTCDSNSTSGAVAIGLWTSWTGVGDDWVRKTNIRSSAKFKNVKNDNTVLADADGMQVTAPTDKNAKLTIAPGAYFENCKGRAIKSQVVGNSVIAPVIKRTLYDGLSEINLQYAGGSVRGATIEHDGTRVDSVISITQRATPANTQCSISENELTVTGAPSSNTTAMVSTDVTDASVKLQGVTIRDNKVKGTIDYMTSHRVANAVDVNRVVIDGNWADTIAVAYLRSTLFGASRAQLSVVFTNNGCENSCTGAAITDDLIVEYARNNHNITALLANPYTVKMASGVIKAYGGTHRIRTPDGDITAFADGGGGQVVVTSTAHGLLDNDSVTISGTTNYNGTFTATNVTANTFEITDTWVSDDATGSFISPSATLNTIIMTNREPDEWLTLYANNGTRTIVLEDGTGNLRLGGDFSLDNTEDRIVLSHDGTNCVEITRSDNGA